jgi:hypothetical protein
LVYNRKKKLNKSGNALIQVEAYRNRKKVYISTGIYVNPQQWDNRHNRIIQHPHSEELNRMLEEFILQLQWEELKSWKRGVHINLSAFKTISRQNDTEKMTFLSFGRNWVEHSLRKDATKKNLLTTLDLLNNFRSSIIRKTKCFDFWERNVLFPKTKRSFFRTPNHPLPCPFPLNFSLLIITKKFGNLAKNRYICIV